jgi:hypothetical protein
MRANHCIQLAVLSLAALGPSLSQAPSAQSANIPLRNPTKPVQHQPYTVELKTTTVHSLANGTTITRESTEIRAEDSQHRSLFSHTHAFPIGGRQRISTMVHIEDPVEGTRITWDSLKEEATVLRLPPKDQQHGCWQSDSGNMRIDYGPARPVSGGQTGVTSSSPVVVSMGGTSETVPANQAADISSVGVGGGMGSIGALAAGSPRLAHNPPQAEDLGTAIIEGVEVRGRRFTQTIPAGQIGNDQPLVSTTESWTAPNLGIALRSVRDDPQSGKSTTEVVRVDLSDPPLSTFQPPEGYRVIVQELHQVACLSPGLQ